MYASASLPGSPYNNRRSSQPCGRDKLMVLSTYMDAQEHLPYADDSTAATPMSEENGAIVLPFCNGLHQTHTLPSFALGSRHSSYNSHASRLSYTSHDMLAGGRHGGFGQPVTKEMQLIQRAKNLYGGDPEKGYKEYDGVSRSPLMNMMMTSARLPDDLNLLLLPSTLLKNSPSDYSINRSWLRQNNFEKKTSA
ncbi:Sodium channel protein para [Orchesella cincta]|uniref:Sodium channel protein para n=1 Tax=Orchesella cincta TaxID=48709 RepID=A0A1D2M5D1_ORCCI|nr:Sodium channel protein para [Orchesella cincta]